MGGNKGCELVEEVVKGIVEEEFLSELILAVEEVVDEFLGGGGVGIVLDEGEGLDMRASTLMDFEGVVVELERNHLIGELDALGGEIDTPHHVAQDRI